MIKFINFCILLFLSFISNGQKSSTEFGFQFGLNKIGIIRKPEKPACFYNTIGKSYYLVVGKHLSNYYSVSCGISYNQNGWGASKGMEDFNGIAYKILKHDIYLYYLGIQPNLRIQNNNKIQVFLQPGLSFLRLVQMIEIAEIETKGKMKSWGNYKKEDINPWDLRIIGATGIRLSMNENICSEFGYSLQKGILNLSTQNLLVRTHSSGIYFSFFIKNVTKKHMQIKTI